MVRKHTINLDGKQLCIGHHSWTALWQVRLHRLPMLLWMDVLSIDQTNAKEKSTQVDMMGLIYSAAKLTCISLGDHGDDSKFLVEQIRAHTYHIEHLWAKSTGLRESISACSACGLPPIDRMYRCKQCGGSHNICLACKKAHSDKLQHELFLDVRTKSQSRGECVECELPIGMRWYHQRDDLERRLSRICDKCVGLRANRPPVGLGSSGYVCVNEWEQFV